MKNIFRNALLLCTNLCSTMCTTAHLLGWQARFRRKKNNYQVFSADFLMACYTCSFVTPLLPRSLLPTTYCPAATNPIPILYAWDDWVQQRERDPSADSEAICQEMAIADLWWWWCLCLSPALKSLLFFSDLSSIKSQDTYAIATKGHTLKKWPTT